MSNNKKGKSNVVRNIGSRSERNVGKTTISFVSSFKNLDYSQAEVKKQLALLKQAYEKYLKYYLTLSEYQANYQDILTLDGHEDLLSMMTQVLQNETNASSLNLSNLFGDDDMLTILGKRYDEAYTEFFNIFTSTIDLLETIGGNLRNEEIIHHLGMEDEYGLLKEFFLDEQSMAAFRKDREIFKIALKRNKDGDINAALTTRNNLDRNSVISGIQRAIGNRQTELEKYGLGEQKFNPLRNLYYQLYKNSDLVSATVSKKQGQERQAELKAGRIYEAFDQGMLSGNPVGLLHSMTQVVGVLSKGTGINKEIIGDRLRGYLLDTLPWISGGDNSEYYGDKARSISNKFFNFDEKTGALGIAGINLSSLKTMTTALDILSSDKQVIQSKIEQYQAQQGEKMTSEQLYEEFKFWNQQGNNNQGFTSFVGVINGFLTDLRSSGQFQIDDTITAEDLFELK